MKKTTIAFDVDGTLIDSEGHTNWRIVDLLRTLASFKNVEIHVWSGGGQDYAEMWVRKLDIKKYVKKCWAKNHLGIVDGKHQFDPELVPDIAIDDIQDCQLGKLNLIVREK